MKKSIALLLVAAATIGTAAAQPSIGVSIGINQPGVYGRINIGDVPRPALVMPQSVIIVPQRVAVERAPIYLYVPQDHQQNWRQHCGSYGACSQPVFFVRDEWVRERYEHEHPGWKNGKHKGKEKYKYKEKDEDHERGHGNKHGKGHDRRD